MTKTITPIIWTGSHLQLLDQRVLPKQEVYLDFEDAATVALAIRDMVVRGAPAIGITAAFGIAMAARQRFQFNPDNWKSAIEDDLQVLAESRPTAVNLFWAIERMRNKITSIEGAPFPQLVAEAQSIMEEDIAANRRMGDFGAGLITKPCNVLTHCNAGALATGGYGTALGVIRSAHREGKIQRVYADETRPWLQGARLTAWEMVKEGIPVSLLADGAAAHLMKSGLVDWVIVGSDRIAANGDVANKIGTYMLAVLARRHGVKFMIAAPTSTVDMNISSGEQIPIEERPAGEVLGVFGQAIAAPGAEAWNPAFDVTPAELVDAIVTEKGVVLAPDAKKMLAVMQKPL
jgi:methylthioribose-1-phosphate isomerase